MIDPELAATEEAILENVRRGYMEVVGVDDEGQMHYRLTPAGKAYVEALPANGDADA